MKLTLQSKQAADILQNNDPHYARARTLVKEFETLVESKFPSLSAQKRLQEALSVMIDIHFYQKDRPDGQPYISHPLDVALCVLRDYDIQEVDVIVAALLHDSVEDQAERLVARCSEAAPDPSRVREQALDVITQQFGKFPAELVSALSNPPEYDEVEDRETKNQIYMQHLVEMTHANPYAFTIKMADFSHNIVHLGEVKDPKRRKQLQAKYCLAMQFLIAELENLHDPSHPLWNVRDLPLEKMRDARRQNCVNPLINLLHKSVGPWPMNTYLIVCAETGRSAIVDPGADGEAILALAQGTEVEKILITHGHFDHVDALKVVKEATGAPVYLHPADAAHFNLAYDIPLQDGMPITIGNAQVRAIHTPGHTPGATCFDLLDGRILVGDTVFVGGPGKTWSHEEFLTSMRSMQEIVFAWPDETFFYPGHGPSGKIGEERPVFEAFVRRGWADDLYGDVTWKP